MITTSVNLYCAHKDPDDPKTHEWGIRVYDSPIMLYACAECQSVVGGNDLYQYARNTALAKDYPEIKGRLQPSYEEWLIARQKLEDELSTAYGDTGVA